MSVEGVLLAAGAGSRMGMPKALVHDDDGGSWLAHGVETLVDGGCDRVTVVLGASADEAVRLLDGLGVDVVIASDWAEGMSASLRAGLRALPDDGEVAVVLLVDLPDVTAEVVRRVVAAATDPAALPCAALRRAGFDGRPGHPVLIGRDHWAGVLAEANGDEGARSYLRERPVDLVECGDLATGHDVDAR
ncbi:nucleotidyltransferase family protein [Nocardioides sp.]|uniref:nucleotidyltransferase family protein n=1 Tax=Nocardioides sp. TaxID=35761 RepID=UPI00286CB03E|nr:nucleotidyltransferase family protein [Nocardioides sp.]